MLQRAEAAELRGEVRDGGLEATYGGEVAGNDHQKA